MVKFKFDNFSYKYLCCVFFSFREKDRKERRNLVVSYCNSLYKHPYSTVSIAHSGAENFRSFMIMFLAMGRLQPSDAQFAVNSAKLVQPLTITSSNEKQRIIITQDALGVFRHRGMSTQINSGLI